MEMTYDSFLDSMRRRGGLRSAEEAEELAEATLRALGEVLSPDERKELAGALPDSLRAALTSRPSTQTRAIEAFYARVGGDAGLDPARAREAAQFACQAIARAVGNGITRRLRRHLPEEFADLFTDPHGQARVPERLDHEAQANKRTLARGRAGSEHPVSESSPPAGQRGSIATQDNPHGDTQIATGHESTDEDERTLAGGKPGSDRPLSDTHDR